MKTAEQPAGQSAWQKKFKELSVWKLDQSLSGERLTRIKLKSNTLRNFGLSNWLRGNVAIPVKRKHPEAAPHTSPAPWKILDDVWKYHQAASAASRHDAPRRLRAAQTFENALESDAGRASE